MVGSYLERETPRCPELCPGTGGGVQQLVSCVQPVHRGCRSFFFFFFLDLSFNILLPPGLWGVSVLSLGGSLIGALHDLGFSTSLSDFCLLFLLLEMSLTSKFFTRLWSCMSSLISTSSRPYGEYVCNQYLAEGDRSLVVDLSCTVQFRSVQSLDCVQLFATPWILHNLAF